MRGHLAAFFVSSASFVGADRVRAAEKVFFLLPNTSPPVATSVSRCSDGTRGRRRRDPDLREWNETSVPEVWAVRKTVHSPEIGNPVYFDRETAAFAKSLRTGAPARQAHNINRILEALFQSSSQSGAEVRL